MSKLKILRDETVYRGNYISLVKRHFIGTLGVRGTWEMVERTTNHRIVAIAPINSAREIILTKTYRLPFKKYSIELCIGLKDKKGGSTSLTTGETDEQTARRELLEETGYGVKKVKRVVVGPTNPGLVYDDIALFIGTGAKELTRPETENAEDIAVLRIPLRRVLKFLSHPPRGCVVDIKIYIALFFLAKQGYKIG